MGPILEDLARERAGRLKVVKVNVDESPGAAGRFGIQAVPTLMLWRDGAPSPVAQGAMPKRELEKRLESLLV
jgi:thioredoxin 2